jgi:protease-4
MYLKDALNRIGIEAEAIQSSPYKSAPNIFSRSDMTPEEREQLNWQLDEWFDIITAEMASGRQRSQNELQKLIDQAPYMAEEALALGLVDHLAYEDELAQLLGELGTDGEAEADAENGETPDTAEEKKEDDGKPKRRAKLVAWSRAYSLLMEKPRRRSRKSIGVISLQGRIMMGPSRQSPLDFPVPFMGGETAGEQTLVRLLRQAERRDEMAALIFHVDSVGGSSLASELIGRQIERIAKKKPVLVYMGNTAASGGYYVSAGANHVMSQTGTITGSIGVWSLHFSTRDLFDAISINRVTLERGNRVGLYSDEAPLTAEERQILHDSIDDTYAKFKQVVANGRDIPFEELEPICGGQVWTGRQALEHRLVDSHGDFVDVLRKATEMAGLPLDDEHEIPAINLYPKSDGHLPPKPFESASLVGEIGRWLFGERLQQMSRQPLLMMPFDIKFK